MQSEDTHLSLMEELSPEAERISRVLENCISQVKIALCLPAILQFYSKSDVVDQDLSRILKAHQFFEEKLEKLEGQKTKQTTEEDRKMIQLKIDIKNSVRDVLRFFRNHPHALSDLRAELPLEVEEKEFIKTLEEIFHCCMVERLLSVRNENPHEILQNQTISSSSLDVMMSQNQVNETTKHLEEDLERLEDEILRNINGTESFMNDLSSPIEEEKETSPLQEKETSPLQDKERSPLQEKQDETNELSSSSKVATLNADIDQLKAQRNSLMLENHQKQRILREKKEDLEVKAQTLLQTFDKNMEKLESQAQLEALKKESIQEEMMKLQGPFSALEVQYIQIQEKRQLAEETRKEEIKALERKRKAAVTIQAWWRGYSVRKALKNKGKSKSKKGKKIKKGTTKMGKLAETPKISTKKKE